MTDHRRALDLAAAALDWELTAAESNDLRAHLATCPTCPHASAIQEGHATILRSLTFAETPAMVRSVVLAAATGDTRRRRRPGWTMLAAAGLVALVALGAAVGSRLLERQREATSLEVPADPRPQPTTAFSEPSLVPGPPVLGGGLILIVDAAPDSAGAVFTVHPGTGQRTSLGRAVELGLIRGRTMTAELDIQRDADRLRLMITTEFGDAIASLDDPTEAARDLRVVCCEPRNDGDFHYWRLSPQGDRVAGLHSTTIQVPGREGLMGIEDAVAVFDVGDSDIRILPLPAGTIVNGPAAWSPDGSVVVVAGCRPCNNAEFGKPPTAANRAHLFIVPIDGSPVVEVLDEGRATVGSPAWSPDGSTLAFNEADCLPASESPYCSTDGGRTTVQTVSLTDGWRTVVAERPSSAPVWSPDGGRIAFGREDGVFVVNADGSDLIKVADGSEPRWSPDGRWILFTVSADFTAGDLWIVAADGGEPRFIGEELEGAW